MQNKNQVLQELNEVKRAQEKVTIASVWKKLNKKLHIERKEADRLKKPLLILASESHDGLREFIAKCILSSAATRIGIKHHCLERTPGDIIVPMQQESNWDDSVLFYYHLSQLNIFLSEIDRKIYDDLSDANDPLFKIFEGRVAYGEREATVLQACSDLDLRNNSMADYVITAGIDAILYIGKGHEEGLYNLLKDKFHVVVCDVTNLSIRGLERFYRRIEKRTGFSFYELNMSRAFLIQGMLNGRTYPLRIPCDEPKVQSTVIELENNNQSFIRAEYEDHAIALQALRKPFEEMGLYTFSPLSTKDFITTRLDQPLLWQRSFNIQRQDRGWVTEMQACKNNQTRKELIK